MSVKLIEARARFLRLSLTLAFSTMQVTIRFCSVPPQFRRTPWKGGRTMLSEVAGTQYSAALESRKGVPFLRCILFLSSSSASEVKSLRLSESHTGA
ncbi:hypothetical protein TNCV_1967711 [Trichonephila clavipes]|nr:hypothetical protein TNCV_1967711 [Trichonephila clavipes]